MKFPPPPSSLPRMDHRIYLRQIAAKGGRAGKGPAKARSSAQARKAVLTRWKKHRRKRRG